MCPSVSLTNRARRVWGSLYCSRHLNTSHWRLWNVSASCWPMRTLARSLYLLVSFCLLTSRWWVSLEISLTCLYSGQFITRWVIMCSCVFENLAMLLSLRVLTSWSKTCTAKRMFSTPPARTERPTSGRAKAAIHCTAWDSRVWMVSNRSCRDCRVKVIRSEAVNILVFLRHVKVMCK